MQQYYKGASKHCVGMIYCVTTFFMRDKLGRDDQLKQCRHCVDLYCYFKGLNFFSGAKPIYHPTGGYQHVFIVFVVSNKTSRCSASNLEVMRGQARKRTSQSKSVASHIYLFSFSRNFLYVCYVQDELFIKIQTRCCLHFPASDGLYWCCIFHLISASICY